jgi:ribonuclease HI
MKYLGIILDHKFKFQEHIKYAVERCANLIHNLSKAAKMTWVIKHAAIATIYKGTILPLLTYGAPIWIEAMNYEHNRQNYIRVQRLINISMTKAYRTTSSEALCMLTGTTPIIIKLEEAVQRYKAKERTGICKIELDHEVEFKNWPHPADIVTIEEVVRDEEATVCAYTVGSKQDQGVGSGAVIFKGSEMVAKVQLKLDKRCSNNQAEQLAILKALEAIESLNSHSINPRTATIFTDNRVSLDSLHNPNNHAFLVEEIRKKVASLENTEWKIKFSWVKARVGIYGN